MDEAGEFDRSGDETQKPRARDARSADRPSRPAAAPKDAENTEAPSAKLRRAKPRARATPVAVPVAKTASTRDEPVQRSPANRGVDQAGARRRGRRPRRPATDEAPSPPAAPPPPSAPPSPAPRSAPAEQRSPEQTQRARRQAPPHDNVGQQARAGAEPSATNVPPQRPRATPITQPQAATARTAPDAPAAADAATHLGKPTALEAPLRYDAQTAPSVPNEAPAAPPRRKRKTRPAPPLEIAAHAAPLVAPDTVAGRSLAAVLAIMTFVCAVIWGGLVLLDRTTSAWGAATRAEITVTLLPEADAPVEDRLREIATILEAESGLEDIAIVSDRDGRALLEPWLGTGLDLSRLPVPRLVTAVRSGPLDSAALGQRIAAVPGATLDDHSTWEARLSGIASRAIAAAIGALALIMLATALAVVFAARAAVAANAATVEVLFLLGAEDRFIVRAFRKRLVRTGLAGAAVGAGCAAALFAALTVSTWAGRISTGAGVPPLFGEANIGLGGFIGIGAIGAAFAVLTVLAAQWAVRKELAKREV